MKEYRERNREHIRERSNNYRKEHQEQARESNSKSRYKRLYGMLPGEYQQRLADQNGVCAICGVSPGNNPLNVDHDHKTGAVRGLVCHQCNLGLGHFDDTPERLRKAADYLERNP